MGYVDENLMPGETVVARANLHWGMLVGPTFVTGLVGLAMIPFLLVLAAPVEDQYAKSMIPFTLLCCLVPYLLFAAAVIGSAIAKYLTTEFAVTDVRIIAKSGVLRRNSLELHLRKLESIDVSQPLMGRIFGYGTIVASGTGGTHQPFPNIADPMGLRNRINRQIATLQ
jgi:uncharacterized membrane protein YdbT with pleckstrin-like domain